VVRIRIRRIPIPILEDYYVNLVGLKIALLMSRLITMKINGYDVLILR